MKTNFQQIQRNLAEIANRQSYSIDVLYELMAAYGRSASSITKLRGGNINLAQNKETTVLQRGVVYFRNVIKSDSLPAEVEKLEQDPLTARYNPRFLIATDLTSFAAKDTKKGNTLEIKWEDIDRNVDFFYGWTGDEVVDEKTEAAADRRAADKMKELYFEVEKVNADRLAQKDSNFRHELNVFFTRLLFCFFAEDTRVFSNENKSLFTTSIREFTQTDGSDLDQFLGTLFEALDAKDKSSYSSPISNFPYVNGSLFDKTKGITIPKFNAQARKLILDCGALNWAEINPDIFGSMFQSIVDDSLRDTHGMHYTSVPNIMKTIEPLFLDELREEFDKNYDNVKKLQQLWDRISNIKVFDPACGSGNFLIIAYKELRKLEHAIIDRVFEEDYKRTALAGKLTSKIDLNNFYGIEIDDFACEVAILSLYIAKHQMNIEFEKQFGKKIELIPLSDKAHIIEGNATRIDWQDVCPNKPRSASKPNVKQTKLIPDEYEQRELIEAGDNEIWDEIYLISNPPYKGQRNQENYHKEDLKFIFDGQEKYKKLDYVCCWVMKAALYIENTKAKAALVTTDSISQGVQVGQLWPRIFSRGIEISYAYSSFNWTNNAADKAGVTCTVFGLVNKSEYLKEKFLIDGNIKKKVDNINGYLSDSPNFFLKKHNSPISNIPSMVGGAQPREGGYLMLSLDEKNTLIQNDRRSLKFIREMVGSKEVIASTNRWSLWIEDADLSEALTIPDIAARIEKVKQHRSSGNSVEKLFANVPHKFVTTKRPLKSQIAIPSVSSGAREYVPIAFLNKETIVTSSCFCIYDAELDIFALLNSIMHMTWVNYVTGRLRTDINYSSNTCYNAFPIPFYPNNTKQLLIESARSILLTRQNHSEKSLAEMYDPDKMPDDLREVHHQNDILVDKLYRLKPYENEQERLLDLFALYEKMTAEEKNK